MSESTKKVVVRKPRARKPEPTKEEQIAMISEELQNSQQDFGELQLEQGKIAGMGVRIILEMVEDELQSLAEEIAELQDKLKELQACA